MDPLKGDVEHLDAAHGLHLCAQWPESWAEAGAKEIGTSPSASATPRHSRHSLHADLESPLVPVTPVRIALSVSERGDAAVSMGYDIGSCGCGSVGLPSGFPPLASYF